MPVYEKDGAKILFIHIPKTAGSTVGNVFRFLGWSESFVVHSRRASDLTYYKATPQHMDAKTLSMIFNLDEFDRILTIVRNPFDRMKSEYYWQKQQKFTSLRPSEWLEETLEGYEKNPYLYDNHVRPQHEFIPDANNPLIFRLEDDGVRELTKVVIDSTRGLSAYRRWKMTRIEDKVKDKTSEKRGVIEEEFKRHFDRIYSFYRRDYELFGYHDIAVEK